MLTIHGNLVVRGRLDYGTPDDRVCGVKAEIVFQGMVDENFQGTPSPDVDNGGTPGVFPEPLDVPLEVVDSDFGVWVMGSGVFTRRRRSEESLVAAHRNGGPRRRVFRGGGRDRLESR